MCCNDSIASHSTIPWGCLLTSADRHKTTMLTNLFMVACCWILILEDFLVFTYASFIARISSRLYSYLISIIMYYLAVHWIPIFLLCFVHCYSYIALPAAHSFKYSESSFLYFTSFHSVTEITLTISNSSNRSMTCPRWAADQFPSYITELVSNLLCKKHNWKLVNLMTLQTHCIKARLQADSETDRQIMKTHWERCGVAKTYILTSVFLRSVWKSIGFCTNSRCICVPHLVTKCEYVREFCVMFHPDRHRQTNKPSNEYSWQNANFGK